MLDNKHIYEERFSDASALAQPNGELTEAELEGVDGGIGFLPAAALLFKYAHPVITLPVIRPKRK